MSRLLEILQRWCDSERFKDLRHRVLVTATGVGVLLIIAYYANAGELRRIPIDFSVLDDDNPARVEETIEKATTATFLVTSIEGEDDKWEINGKFPGHDDIRVSAYVSRKDVARVDIGDLITVRGEIRYSLGLYHPYIYIGHPYTTMLPPGLFHAKIEEIIKN